jgi:hypothetical protein
MTENPTTRRRYLYQAVSGASVWGTLVSLRSARQAVCALRTRYPEAEVERVFIHPNKARTYWRWRNGRWSLKHHFDPAPADLMKWDYAPSIAGMVNHV